VTGSRGWVDEDAIRGAFAQVISLHGPENVTVVHGACPHGADALADEIAAGWTGLTIERHPADWDRHGRAAGFRRNAEMVDAGADVCLAFIGPCSKRGCPDPQPHGSHGASHTADLAEKAGIPVRRFPVRDTAGGDAA
jgi:hypothetical protein